MSSAVTRPATAAVDYSIIAANPGAHLFAVRCTVPAPDPAGQILWLPAWIPGSYMIRDFARHIISIHAALDGQPWPLTKLDKDRWQAAPLAAGQGAGTLVIDYEIYARDPSVRSADLDISRGFFNGSSVFLAVSGREQAPCTVDIRRPQGEAFRDWELATSLPPLDGAAGAPAAAGFTRYAVADYDELIDHPVEMGRLTRQRFEVAGVPHELVLSGRHDCDLDRVCADLQRICRWQVELFGGEAPMDYYAFLTRVVGEGYGGLEHRASTALICSRHDLPWAGMGAPGESYIGFLGLCSHEYFHSWNVKRIKPAAFTPYDLSRENYTRLLWAFEGFTSYYDDLSLVRSGVITAADYLGLLGKTISRVLRGSGRLKQSVAESSFDAWTRFYLQDENAPNAIVSYYSKGALIALLLDLQLRAASAGERSLDDVMRLLWRQYGDGRTGVAEDGIFAAVVEVGGEAPADWLREAVNGREDLPLAAWLARFGVSWTAEAESAAPTLGVQLAASREHCRLSHVHDGGAAQAVGLAAGDVIIAADGLRIADGKAFEQLLARRQPGQRLRLHVFRRDELMEFEPCLATPQPASIRLDAAADADAGMLALQGGWLGSA